MRRYFFRASDTNCTVYCGGLIDTDENTIRREFNSFSRIMEIRYFKDKGYAFIRYNNKVRIYCQKTSETNQITKMEPEVHFY